MRKSMTFNGQKKPWLHLLEGRQKSPFAPIRNNLIRVNGKAGAYVSGKETDVLYITQPIGFVVDNDEHALQLKDELAAWLVTNEAVPLEFDDEPGRTYYAEIEGTIEDFSKFVDQRRGVITFLCADPYSYGPEKTLTFPADIVTIENQGTAKADPIFELEATKKTTFAMVSNQDDEYNLVGQPVDEDGHEQIIDKRVSVLYENGSMIDTWLPTSDMTDDYFIDVSGSMMTDDAGIRTQSYGTGNRMHGPAVMKELPKTLQDFEIETTFDIISRRPEENFRMEIYFHDENMNMLGKLGIKDDNRSYLRRRGLGRVGPYRGSGSKNGYAIGKHNYSYDDSRETTLMYLRVKREGKRYTFYIAEWYNRKHRRNITATYNDVNNLYQGKLKYITLFIGKYQDRPNPARLRINSVEVFELARIVEDQTPYILYPGDVIEFDHAEKDIRLNGESRKDLKNFGASFFTLKKGENMLIVTPEDSFNTKVTFRNRYL
ncbi:distal tail protein Dit [Pseudogracilibacillus auburnensis]|uniref:Putative phage tail component-like protein n=1 Tax=Pseudogracilibacillus auburnensis TaxID=1494959 RepID=A0A2V3W3E7_9BACI|nr:distal tail protein Dit [Pseudogracilibacillus auburnensis]PXW88827.1 putative phage tail component-like protein [Pseudogracilibacillus auburnensis]